MKLERRGDPPDTDGADEREPDAVRETETKPKNKRQRSVIVYMLVLFVVALGLIVLSYFIQQRRSEATISDITERHSEFSIQALQNIEDLQNYSLELERENGELKAEIQQMEGEVSDAEDARDAAESELRDAEDQARQLSESLEIQEKRTAAAEALLKLYRAYVSGEDTAQLLGDVDAVSEYLDGESAELYRELRDEITTGEEEND